MLDQLMLRQTLRVGDQLGLEPDQLSGQRAAYQILSIDGNLVKISTPEGFRMLPLYTLLECAREGRLQLNGTLVLP